MHLLNPIIERTDTENRSLSAGKYFYPPKHFVSCSCGWQGWWGSRYVGEDAWIEHMVNVSYSRSHSEPFNTGVDGE